MTGSIIRRDRFRIVGRERVLGSAVPAEDAHEELAKFYAFNKIEAI